jgi:hypothetical protein
MTPDAILEGSLIYDVRPKNSKIGQGIREATRDSNAKFPIVGHPNVAYT